MDFSFQQKAGRVMFSPPFPPPPPPPPPCLGAHITYETRGGSGPIREATGYMGNRGRSSFAVLLFFALPNSDYVFGSRRSDF